MKRIALIENEEKYRKILQEELSSGKEWELSFYHSGEEFWREKKMDKFDLIYVDINLVHMNGIELVSRVYDKLPELKMVMLTGLGTDEHIFSALQAGAFGYIWKSELGNLSQVTETFLSGGSFMSPTIAFRIQNYFKREKIKSKLKAELTNREIQITELMVQAETTERIADICGISVNTVNNHISKIYSKLQVNSRAKLIRKADEIGIRF
ncbi:MAG: response regulator transcription factor [Leptospiraceae bacterium]|nr:response regulator transcription factor [Leptospiraceae bacterium]